LATKDANPEVLGHLQRYQKCILKTKSCGSSLTKISKIQTKILAKRFKNKVLKKKQFQVDKRLIVDKAGFQHSAYQKR
jgi:hypothetical protein